MNNTEQESSISLLDIWYAIIKRWILVLIITLGVTAAGGSYAFFIAHPTYVSSSNVIVSVEAQSTGGTGETIDYTNSLRVVNTVGDLVKQDIVLLPVAEKYDVDVNSLRNGVSTKVSSTSFMITISVVDRDIELAQKYTDEIVESLIKVTKEDDAIKVLKVTLSQAGKASEAKYNSPNKTLIVIGSFAGGLVVGCALAFILEIASNTFKTKKEIEDKFQKYNVIGKFYDDKEKAKRNKKDHRRHHSQLVKKGLREFEPYNTLLSNIYYSNPENPYKVVLITSAQASNLKSMTCANAAYCAATNGKKVVVIDFDVRKPTLHKTFHVSKEIGLIDYIAGTKTQEEIIKHSDSGVDVITGGTNIINPIALISSGKVEELIKELKEKYDYVFIDTPPITVCTDACILSKLADGVVFNISMNVTKKNLAVESIKSLESYDAKIIGINLTLYPTKSHGDYYYYYNSEYYSSSKEETAEVEEKPATEEKAE